MKCVDEFSRFLVDEVNLNQTRIDTLASRVGTIETFLTNSSWKPKIRGFSPQGSWAHRTIIKPGTGSLFAMTTASQPSSSPRASSVSEMSTSRT